MSDERDEEELGDLIVLPGGKKDASDEEVERYALDFERTAADITEAEKVEFLQLIRQGYNRQEAAGALHYRARVWRSLCSPESRHYDEDFANAYADAKGSPETRLNMVERLREEGFRRAMIDSDRLLEKYLMVFDPEFAVLRQKDVNVNIRAVIQQQFRDLPTELLEQLLQHLDQQAAEQIVEGEFAELNPAGGNDGDH